MIGTEIAMQPRRPGDAENKRGGIMNFYEFRAQKNEADPELDQLTEKIIGACIEVHKELGPGLTENFYQEALCRELDLRGISYQKQVPISVMYKGAQIGKTRLDLIVAGQVILELKSCEALNAVHRAQLICYLQVTRLKVGLLVNFNVAMLRDGIKRVVRTP
jgi:GxxExxY protein